MENIELGNTREEDLKEIELIIQDAEVKELLETFLTIIEIRRINYTFLKEHLKINKTAARVINDAGILNATTGMHLLHLELQRKSKVDLQSWWKDEVEAKFKKMHSLLIQSVEQMENCGDQIESTLSKLIDKFPIN